MSVFSCFCLLFSVHQRQQEGDDGRRDPEQGDGSEIVMLRTVRGDGDVRVDEPSGRHVLNARGDVGGDSHDPERGSRGLAGYDIHGHQSSEEADQHADCYSEEHHRENVHPHGISSVEEQDQRQGVQYAEQQGGNLSVTLEQLVREPPGEHGSENSQQCVYRDYGNRLYIRESLGLLEEQHSPSVYGISGYVHECA